MPQSVDTVMTQTEGSYRMQIHAPRQGRDVTTLTLSINKGSEEVPDWEPSQYFQLDREAATVAGRFLLHIGQFNGPNDLIHSKVL